MATSTATAQSSNAGILSPDSLLSDTTLLHVNPRFSFGFFAGGWKGYATSNYNSTYSGSAGFLLALECYLPKYNLTIWFDAFAGTISSLEDQIVYNDGDIPVNTTMDILNNTSHLRGGLTYSPFDDKVISPFIFVCAGRAGSHTIMTINRPRPDEEDLPIYFSRETIHKDGQLGFGFGLGLRFAFTRLFKTQERAIGFLDLRCGYWKTGSLEYMNSKASIKSEIDLNSIEDYSGVLANSQLYRSQYYTDYIYKTPLDMMYFSISIGLRFN